MSVAPDFTRLYADFNARRIDDVLALLHPDVDWPNGWEGGYVHGVPAVRDYWTRQWAAINPSVVPVAINDNGKGTVTVRVHQVVKDLGGAVLGDEQLDHVYEITDGLIRTMEIRK
ncbi:MAG TPA: nuclear transport factor 2 family protein [Devosia sp.]|jgi:hypothetical protein|nr:nuclear transport factor 2 family protein [Devosia sp.]